MELEIRNPNNLKLDEFIYDSLIPTIQEYVVSRIDNSRLIKIEEYLNSLNISEYKRYISARDMIIAAVYNLKSTKQPDNSYIISIDSAQTAPNIRAKIIDIAQLINYGSLSTPAYPIFDDTFLFFADRLNDLYNKYSLGGVS